MNWEIVMMVDGAETTCQVEAWDELTATARAGASISITRTFRDLVVVMTRVLDEQEQQRKQEQETEFYPSGKVYKPRHAATVTTDEHYGF